MNDYGLVRVCEKWEFDSSNSVFKNHTKFYTKGENKAYKRLVLNLSTQMILYTLEELKEIATKAGWKYLSEVFLLNSIIKFTQFEANNKYYSF